MKLIMPQEEYLKNGLWKNKNLFLNLMKHAQKSGDQTAYVDNHGNRISYSNLLEKVKVMAGSLIESGIKPGDVVSFQLPNWAEAIVVYKALQMIGAIANPIIPIYRKKELEYIIRNSKTKILFVPYRFRNFNYLEMTRNLEGVPELEKVVVVDFYNDNPKLDNQKETSYKSFLNNGFSNEDIYPVNEKTIAVLIYTSGTTSQPKGVLMSHNTLLSQVERYQTTFNLTSKDIIFTFGSFGHVSGLNVGVEIPLTLGCKTVHQDIWNAREAVELLLNEEVTWGLGATPFLNGLITEIKSLKLSRRSKLKLSNFLCGGADVQPELIYEARRILNCFVGRTYGATEAGSVTLTTASDPIEKAANTDGKLHELKKVKIVNDKQEEVQVGAMGEIAVKGPDMFLGYLQSEFNESCFTSDGYFLTGDLGVVDEEGYLEIKARKKDIIIRGGENISVKEVEDILYQHPSISSIAIVAMPDELMGEKACAYVEIKEGEQFTFKEMIDFLQLHDIAKQKYPERLEIIDKMPLNANGKIQKFKLREDINKKIKMELKSR